MAVSTYSDEEGQKVKDGATYDDETDEDADYGGDPGPRKEEETDEGDSHEAEEAKVEAGGEVIAAEVLEKFVDVLHIRLLACS